MAKFVYDASRPPGQRFVEVDPTYRPPPRRRLQIANRSQEPLKSMADGKYYSCRAKMEREQEAQGYVVAQDADRPLFDPKPMATDWTGAIKDACDQLGVDPV